MTDSRLAAYRAHLDRLTPAASSYTARYSSFQRHRDKDVNSGRETTAEATDVSSAAEASTRNTSGISSSAVSKASRSNIECSSQSSSFPVSSPERAIVVSNAVSHTDNYYDIVTRSYEAGWSRHFHYCPFAPGDTIDHALKFYVYRLAILMGLKPGMKVLDVGCGIGGPARELAKLVGCEVVGVTINQFQVDRAIEITVREGLGGLCTFVRGDFMRLDEIFPEEAFDAAFACEATCHAPSLEMIYAQVWRVVKRGGVFGFTEEVLTDPLAETRSQSDGQGRYVYDEESVRHQEIRGRIEVGGGMASLRTVTQARQALRRAGFEIEVDDDYTRYFEKLSGPVPVVFEEEGREVNGGCYFEGRRVKSFSPVKIPTCDGSGWRLAPPPSAPCPHLKSTKYHPIPPIFRPWYYPILGTKKAVSLAVSAEDRKTVSRMSHWNRRVAFFLRKVYVWLGWSPPGLVQLNKMMELYIDGSIDGAREGIFSPCWMFVCRKIDGGCDPRLLQTNNPGKGRSSAANRSDGSSDSERTAVRQEDVVSPRKPVHVREQDDVDEMCSIPQNDIVDMFEVGVLAKP